MQNIDFSWDCQQKLWLGQKTLILAGTVIKNKAKIMQNVARYCGNGRFFEWGGISRSGAGRVAAGA